jgi:hypothetical protein
MTVPLLLSSLAYKVKPCEQKNTHSGKSGCAKREEGKKIRPPPNTAKFANQLVE